MQWYYSKNGTQLGPISESELRAKVAAGDVSSADMVWKEGMTDWQQAGKVSGLDLPSSTLVPVPSISGTAVTSPYASPAVQVPGGPEIPNYLWQSIVVTVLCCWPVGIPAIVYAAKVDGLKVRGDFTGAAAASASAKKWCIIALSVWGVLIVGYIIVTVGAFAVGGTGM